MTARPVDGPFMIGTTPRVIVQRVRGAAPPRQPDTRLVEKARRSFRALNPARPRDILINDGPTCQPNLETSALSAGIPGGRPPPPRQGGCGAIDSINSFHARVELDDREEAGMHGMHTFLSTTIAYDPGQTVY